MAFTPITADTSWQDLAIAQQIAVAYNKRRTACALSTLTVPDSAVKVFDFVYAVQSGIEDMATRWGNPTVPLSGQTALPERFASVSACMSYAGLTMGGYWRRIADGGTQPASWSSYTAAGWSYGKIVSKDLAGPWLWQDLMSALSALKRLVNGASTSNYTVSDSYNEVRVTASPATPTWEASGAPDRTAVSQTLTGGELLLVVRKTYDEFQYAADDIDTIDASFRALRLLPDDTVGGPSGSSTTRRFVLLIPADTTEVFASITGLSTASIGKTVAVVPTEADGKATWWPATPTALPSDWSTLSGFIAWADVPTNTAIAKRLAIPAANRRYVCDYAFVDGATS